jgi:hypothetical protein
MLNDGRRRRFKGLFPSPTGRGFRALSASGFAGMAAAAFCCDDLAEVIPEKKEEFFPDRHRAFQIVCKGFRIRSVVIVMLCHLRK